MLPMITAIAVNLCLLVIGVAAISVSIEKLRKSLASDISKVQALLGEIRDKLGK